MWMLIVSLLITGVVICHADESTTASDDSDDGARILVSKFFLSQYAVEEKDYVVDYRLYNTGDKPATKVTLDDRHSFPTQTFEIVRGLLQVRWERIAPGTNVTHSVVLRPRQFGSMTYTAAQVTYFPSEEANEVRVGFSNTPGEGYIYRLKEYERRFSSKIIEWGIFALMAAPSIGLPLMLWYRTKSKYAQDVKNKTK